MARTRFPYSRTISIEEEIDRLIKELFTQSREFFGLSGSWLPRVDVKEDKERIIVEVEVPGVAREDLDIYLKNTILVITGVKREKPSRRSAKFLRLEREFGSFQRNILLPVPVVSAEAEATLEKGLLKIILKKYKAAKEAVRIPIKSSK
ncbi:Hsp20/alpha crystallin family protein [Candidatus Aminicenantes bacterium AC-334-K16]|jgi:HSP20 family protein|nr:Hsp20/alpha crystallin family protein [Candidatus Aminicenantes bacterium AC-334-K16]